MLTCSPHVIQLYTFILSTQLLLLSISELLLVVFLPCFVLIFSAPPSSSSPVKLILPINPPPSLSHCFSRSPCKLVPTSSPASFLSVLTILSNQTPYTQLPSPLFSTLSETSYSPFLSLPLSFSLLTPMYPFISVLSPRLTLFFDQPSPSVSLPSPLTLSNSTYLYISLSANSYLPPHLLSFSKSNTPL